MRLVILYAIGFFSAFLLAALAIPAGAKQTENGKVAGSAVGTAGERQTRGQLEAVIQPMARINNRIANRVQNRLRTRIDRNDNPKANAVSAFEAAADQARKGSALAPR